MTNPRTASALVIDDEVPALDELSYLLRTSFSIAPVDAARNSGDAFRFLQERSYDVVFLDVRMPTLNGIELGNVLRRFAAPPAIVFMRCSKPRRKGCNPPVRVMLPSGKIQTASPFWMARPQSRNA